MSEPRAGKSVTVGDFEIEPIERTVVRVDSIGGAIVAVAMKEPVSVVIRSSRGAWQVNLESPDRTS